MSATAVSLLSVAPTATVLRWLLFAVPAAGPSTRARAYTHVGLGVGAALNTLSVEESRRCVKCSMSRVRSSGCSVCPPAECSVALSFSRNASSLRSTPEE